MVPLHVATLAVQRELPKFMSHVLFTIHAGLHIMVTHRVYKFAVGECRLISIYATISFLRLSLPRSHSSGESIVLGNLLFHDYE